MDEIDGIEEIDIVWSSVEEDNIFRHFNLPSAK